MPILDTKEDRRLRHLRDEHGTYSAAVIYSLETQLAESKADEWNAFIKRKQAEAVENAFMDLAASIRKIEGLDGISVKGLIHAAEEYATALLSTEEQNDE